MITIFHVTDLHLRQALPGHNGHVHRLSRHMPSLLAQLAERIGAMAPDLVAVTGDLLDVPHALLDREPGYDLRALTQGALADYGLVRRWLESLGRPWMVLPGNHDHGPTFDVVFGSEPTTRRFGPLTVHAFHDWEQAGNQALRIGPPRRHFEQVIAAATEATDEVHLQHFLIRPHVDYHYPLLYGDADDIARRVAEAPGRRLLLSGHWHEGTPMVQIGNALMGGCPAFCEPPHRYRVFRIEPGQPVSMQEEALGASFAPGTRLTILDRPGLLTLPPATDGAGRLTPRPDTGRILAGLATRGHLAIASPWHAPETDAASWRGVQYAHDAFFQDLPAGTRQADALCIYLPPGDQPGRRLPAEAITREPELVPRLAALFGAAPTEVTLLTTDPARRAAAVAAGAASPDLGGPMPDGEAILAAAGL
ncbi:metallophosphoesterase family protein [Teichococcus oryzae]|nr:metallophosphoesterase [Pseudoroseomonas oryzae]